MNNDIPTTKHLGRIIRQRRKAKGLSLEKTAELCNLSTRGLEKIELGDSDPKWSSVANLAGVLEMDMGDFSVCVEYNVKPLWVYS